MKTRVIVIGFQPKDNNHDKRVLELIEGWAMDNFEELHAVLRSKKLDVYDMGKNPRKGDALAALRKHDDVLAVIALHLYGLDSDMTHGSDRNYCYSRENHKLLDECLERRVPLICYGDQPFRKSQKMPKGIKRIEITRTPMTDLEGIDRGVPMPIRVYYKEQS
jgi:hypothetical protein